MQTSQAAAYAGLAVLAPVLRDQYDLSLTQVGVLLGVANVGALLTFLAWGVLADRIGERATAIVGLTGAAAGFAGAAYAPDFVSLVVILALANAFGASSNTATGRAVASWFPSSERGFALGIRQASVPIGGFAAALVIPAIAGTRTRGRRSSPWRCSRRSRPWSPLRGSSRDPFAGRRAARSTRFATRCGTAASGGSAWGARSWCTRRLR